MNIERQLLHNLALRLRWTKRYWKRAQENCYPLGITSQEEGAFFEAHNSFQAAKQIYFDSLEETQGEV